MKWIVATLAMPLRRVPIARCCTVPLEIVDEIKREDADLKKWTGIPAQANNDIALNPHPRNHVMAKDIDTYIDKRSINANILANKVATRTLSTLLTFPLTLSHALRKIFPSPMSSLNVLVVGARAEASLPG